MFDVLRLDGQSMMDLQYPYRRTLLARSASTGADWHTPHGWAGDATTEVRTVSLQHGLEGVVAKRLESRYEPGARP